MDTSGVALESALQAFAVALAEADDKGVDARVVRLGLETRWLDVTGEAGIVEDVVLAATALLAGVDPDVPGLVELWGTDGVMKAVTWAAGLLPTVRPDV